jgi:hypothetical protein
MHFNIILTPATDLQVTSSSSFPTKPPHTPSPAPYFPTTPAFFPTKPPHTPSPAPYSPTTPTCFLTKPTHTPSPAPYSPTTPAPYSPTTPAFSNNPSLFPTSICKPMFGRRINKDIEFFLKCHVGVELGLSYWGQNVDWGSPTTCYWGGFLDKRGGGSNRSLQEIKHIKMTVAILCISYNFVLVTKDRRARRVGMCQVWVRRESIQSFVWEIWRTDTNWNLKDGHQLKQLDVKEKIILKWI